MTEGTKIGEFDTTDEFSTAIRKETVVDSEAGESATKIGELSDFEKSLYDSEGPSDTAAAAESPTENTEEAEAEVVAAIDEDIKRGPSEASSFFQDELERLVMDYEEGDIIEGTVRRVEKAGVMVDINYKSDGFIANNEFAHDSSVVVSDVVKSGDKVQVYIVKLESKEGYTVLSKKRADYELAWTEIADCSRSRDTIDVKCTSNVQGGVVAEYNGIRGFIPASQILSEQDSTFEEFVGETITVSVLQVDRRRRKVIFSQKQANNRTSRADANKLIEEMEVGQVREGRVTSVKEFGAFVDLGGVEGLVHISELSWSRVNNPSDVVALGDEVKVFILGVDRETGRVSLGMKQLEPDPWVEVNENYKVGQVVNGVISRVVTFGAFFRVDDRLEGLIHISELSDGHVESVGDVVKVGQEIEARIIKLIPEEQKIGLSLRGVHAGEPADSADSADSADNNSESLSAVGAAFEAANASDSAVDESVAAELDAAIEDANQETAEATD